jgi:predicted TIM-barrel fold metal-dependent hydrolase
MMGENQVLLGSDFPTVGLLKDSVAIIRKAKTTTQVKKKILGDNARRLFK